MLAVEWEIAVAYAPKKRRANQHLDVNVRIMREDGKPSTKTEATEVWRRFRKGGNIPQGWTVSFIEWTRPRKWKEWHSGDDVNAFHDLGGPLVRGPYRINPVKE